MTYCCEKTRWFYHYCIFLKSFKVWTHRLTSSSPQTYEFSIYTIHAYSLPKFLLIMQTERARRARLRAPEFVGPAWQLEERETELGATQVRCWSSTFFKLQRNAALPPATFATLLPPTTLPPYHHPVFGPVNWRVRIVNAPQWPGQCVDLY